MKSPGGGNKTKSGRMMKAQTATGPPSNSAQLIALRKASPAPQHAAPSSSEESSPNFTSGLRKVAPVEKQAPTEESSPNFTSGLRKAAPVDRPAPTPTANPNFTAGLKTSGADKTKSGRLKKAQAATGPAPSPDFRAGLKKNPTSTN